MKRILVFMTCLLSMHINSFAQYGVPPRFFHIYAETMDGGKGTIGCLNTGKTKELGGRTYTELNVGDLQEDYSSRWETQVNGQTIAVSEEEMEKTGKNLYYREEDGKIYFYSDEKQVEELVMDFTLDVGDSFMLPNGEEMTVVSIKDTIPFAYMDWKPCRKLALQERGNPANTDVWIEEIGSLQTGFLPKSFLSNIRKTKLVGEAIEGYYAFFPLAEETYKAQWIRYLENAEDAVVHLNYEFVGDTLCLNGYLNTMCAGEPFQCIVSGTDIEISPISFPYALSTTCISTYKIEAKFPGFEDGVYRVSYSGSAPVEVVCGETQSIGGINTDEEDMNNSVHDLSGRPASFPSKGIYIRNGKKVMAK